MGDCLECASGYSRSGDDEGAECKGELEKKIVGQ